MGQEEAVVSRIQKELWLYKRIPEPSSEEQSCRKLAQQRGYQGERYSKLSLFPPSNHTNGNLPEFQNELLILHTPLLFDNHCHQSHQGSKPW